MVPPASRPALFTALALLACLPAAGAQAQALDLTRATCADFIGMSGGDQGQLALWLAGYYAGGAQRPALDIARVAAAPAELLALCAKTPQLPLIGAETRVVFMPPAAP